MNYKHLYHGFLSLVFVLLMACNSNNDAGSSSSDTSASSDNSTSTDASTEGTNPKGIGKYQKVELTHPLDEQMVTAGKSVIDVKCSSCHKLTEEKLVGPGYKGVTDRRTPEWIMNFVTNTEEMIAKDTAAQNMLEVCLVKMPNQGLTETDARAVLEFFRKNDGKQ